MRRSSMAAVGAVVTLALVLGASVSARADSAPSSPQLGGFALGDRLEALIDERTGAFQFSAPVAGLMLAWDSRFAASDRDGLGDGWGFGLATVATAGGVRVYPASGGVYEADASSATGLQGYPTTEVKFTQTAGVLDPRPAGTGGTAETAVSRAYAYSLAELGGATTYFDEHGAAIARVDAFGDRTDWVRDPERAHRLTTVIDPDGVVTELDWTSASDRVSIRRGTNLDESAGARERAQTWVVEFDGIGLAVTDPTGGRLDVVGRDGLVSRIEGVAGATTEVTWHAHDDGVPRVAEVRTLDDDHEVSVRRWSMQGASATGWPAVQEPTPATGVEAGGGYTTVLSDGSTRLVSDYTPLQQLARRSLEIASAGGSSVVQEQVFDYPDLGGGDQNGGPGDWSRPTATEVTYHDAGGGARTVREEYVYDALGRMTSKAEGNGVTTAYTFTSASQIATETTTKGSEQLSHRRYAYDERGNLGSVTERTDAAGAVVERYVYSDYGRVLEHVSAGPNAPATGADRNPHGYAGEYTDRFGAQWLHARTYDSDTMRLTTQDTADLHNLYNFADLNPITLADPTGRTPESDAALHGALGGLSIVFGVITGVGAIATGGASLGFFGVVGLVADFVGVGIATTLLVDDLSSWSLPPNVKEGLTYGEYGLAGLGLLGAAETGVKLAVNAYRSERAANAVATRLAIRESLIAANVNGEPAITRLDSLRGDAFAHVLGKTVFTARQTYVEFLYDSNKKSLYVGAHRSNGARMSAVEQTAVTSNHEELLRYTGNPGLDVRLDGPAEAYLAARGHLTGGTISLPYRSKSGEWKVRFTDDSGHFAGSAPQVFWSDDRHAAIAKYFSDRGIRATFHSYNSKYIGKFRGVMGRAVADLKALKFE